MELSAYPVGIEFRLFGTPHLTALGLVVVANLVVWRLRRVPHVMVHTAVRYALAFTIAAAFVAYLLWRVSASLWDVRTDLPLQLCDVMAIMTVALLLTRHRPLYDFVYFLGIGGALQALITSNVGVYGYPHVYFLTSMAAHGAIVTTGVYVAVVEGYRPTWKALWQVAGCAVAYAAAIFVLNLALGSNYLFIARKPEFPSVIDWLGPWPWYVPVLVGMGLVVLHLLYLPFVWTRWRGRGRPGTVASE